MDALPQFSDALGRESIRVIRSFLRDSDIRRRGIHLACAKFFTMVNARERAGDYARRTSRRKR